MTNWSLPPMQLRLRTWLLALSLLSMLPWMLTVMFGLLLSQREQAFQVEEDVRAQTRELAHQLEKRIQKASSTLQTLAESSAAQQDDLHALYESAKRVVDLNPQEFRAVTLINQQEELLFVSSVPYGNSTFTTIQLDLVRDVLKNGATNVSGPFLSRVRSDPLVAVSVPLRQKGRIQYCLRMVMPTVSLSELLHNTVTRTGWVAVVVDRQGNVVARNIEPERFVGGRMAQTSYAALLRGEKSPFHFVSLEGIPSTGLLMPVHGGDWYVGVSAPDNLLHGSASKALRYLWLGALAGLLLAIGLSQWLTGYLTKQAQTMAETLGVTSTNERLHVQEFLNIVKRFWQARQEQEALGNELTQVSNQRDEVRDLYDHAPCGFHSVDAEGRVLDMNQTELDWLGYTHEEVLGTDIAQYLTAKGQATFHSEFPRLKQQGEVKEIAVEMVRKNGSAFPVLISATVLKTPDGAFLKSRSIVISLADHSDEGSRTLKNPS